MPTYLEQVLISVPRPVATLLTHDGQEFPGGNICNARRIDSTVHDGAVTPRADNTLAYVETGFAFEEHPGFVCDAFAEGAVRAIMGAVGKAANNAELVLEVPPTRVLRGWRFHLQIFRANVTQYFEPVQEVRSSGGIQWHRATFENMRILATEEIAQLG